MAHLVATPTLSFMVLFLLSFNLSCKEPDHLVLDEAGREASVDLSEQESVLVDFSTDLPYCGNGYCDGNESMISCWVDCKPKARRPATPWDPGFIDPIERFYRRGR